MARRDPVSLLIWQQHLFEGVQHPCEVAGIAMAALGEAGDQAFDVIQSMADRSHIAVVDLIGVAATLCGNRCNLCE